MSEEEVIKRRLLFDVDDRRVNVLLKMVTKWMHTDGDMEHHQMRDKILAQLSLVEHSRRISDFVTKSNNEQLKKYQDLYSDFETNITNIKEKIANQRLELEKAKVIKQNRIQYDLLAKAIAQEPARTDMNMKLILLQKELQELGEKKRDLGQKLDNRTKQFNVLSASAHTMRSMLKYDEDMEEKPADSSVDLLAEAITQEPARTDMNTKLILLLKELEELGENKKDLEQKLDTWKKQFHVVSTSANALRLMLKDDQDMEKKPADSSMK